MTNILILIMTLGVILYLFYTLWAAKDALSKYLTSVGGKKPKVVHLNPKVTAVVIFIHLLLGIGLCCYIYSNETDGRAVSRLLTSIIISLAGILLLFFVYFIIGVVVKEILSVRDTMISILLIYSILSFAILFYQLLGGKITYPKAFIWINIILYISNLLSIGKMIWTIFRKKISVKSIWSIALLNIGFAVSALANIAFVIQQVYASPCYSRPLKSWGDALYFVVISFFTVGYGDLYPICETTKILSMCVIITGFTFTAVFVSAALSTTMEHFSHMPKKEE